MDEDLRRIFQEEFREQTGTSWGLVDKLKIEKSFDTKEITRRDIENVCGKVARYSAERAHTMSAALMAILTTFVLSFMGLIKFWYAPLVFIAATIGFYIAFFIGNLIFLDIHIKLKFRKKDRNVT